LARGGYRLPTATALGVVNRLVSPVLAFGRLRGANSACAKIKMSSVPLVRVVLTTNHAPTVLNLIEINVH
jgi:hypothetical protein